MTDPAAPDLAIVERLRESVVVGYYSDGYASIGRDKDGNIVCKGRTQTPMTRLANRDGPEAAQRIEMLVEALEKIASGSKLGTAMFEARVKARKSGLTWWAANILQDHLEACEGTARAALAKVRGR